MAKVYIEHLLSTELKRQKKKNEAENCPFLKKHTILLRISPISKLLGNIFFFQKRFTTLTNGDQNERQPKSCFSGIPGRSLSRQLSVTRLGKIPPLWQHIKNYWVIFDGSYELLNLFKQICNAARQFFIVVNGQILRKLPNHLVTLRQLKIKPTISSVLPDVNDSFF